MPVANWFGKGPCARFALSANRESERSPFHATLHRFTVMYHNKLINSSHAIPVASGVPSVWCLSVIITCGNTPWAIGFIVCSIKEIFSIFCAVGSNASAPSMVSNWIAGQPKFSASHPDSHPFLHHSNCRFQCGR